MDSKFAGFSVKSDRGRNFPRHEKETTIDDAYKELLQQKVVAVARNAMTTRKKGEHT